MWPCRARSPQWRSTQEPSGTRVDLREQAKKYQPETSWFWGYGGAGGNLTHFAYRVLNLNNFSTNFSPNPPNFDTSNDTSRRLFAPRDANKLQAVSCCGEGRSVQGIWRYISAIYGIEPSSAS